MRFEWYRMHQHTVRVRFYGVVRRVGDSREGCTWPTGTNIVTPRYRIACLGVITAHSWMTFKNREYLERRLVSLASTFALRSQADQQNSCATNFERPWRYLIPRQF